MASVGHSSMQVPQSTHLSASTEHTPSTLKASLGHASTHTLQPTHSSVLIVTAMSISFSPAPSAWGLVVHYSNKTARIKGLFRNLKSVTLPKRMHARSEYPGQEDGVPGRREHPRAGGRRDSEEGPGAPGSRAFGPTRTSVREGQNKQEDGVPGPSAATSGSAVRRTAERIT